MNRNKMTIAVKSAMGVVAFAGALSSGLDFSQDDESKNE